LSSLLLSVDLEDVRDWVKNGSTYREAVPPNTRRYLEQFSEWGVKATFFIVGTVARRYPALIKEIADAGHEIACHGNRHHQIDKLSRQEFRLDLQENLEALRSCGVKEIYGYRAPTFSLTEQTSWAHAVLADLGFTYSSSVLPAKNPLYGWPEFGKSIRKVAGGLLEIPITLHSILGFSVPVAGGVYFRVLPFFLIRWVVCNNVKMSHPVTTYFHPYDIDVSQERFMHPDLKEKQHLNILMYIGRNKVLKRLDKLHKNIPFQSYGAYVDWLNGR
jgi:polysaccharide deacetylase family protein (PEP-CTERM system associated)